MISFAQNFEDVLLERLFHSKRRGFYVDVGAWDPNRYSVTRHFYQRGWRGVNIEPIARRHKLFVEQRIRDVNLLQLIGRGATVQRFLECADEDYLSTTVTAIADELRKAGHEIIEYDVEVKTLDEIFEQHCPKVVDFLKIDTEGSEAEVLRTIDLTRYRPRSLVVESTIPGSGLKSWDEPEAYGTWIEWEQSVLDADYVFAHFDGLNRFYLRREDAKLSGRLTLPPGIYDGISCSENWQSQALERLEVIDHQQAEIVSLREESEATVASLRQSCEASEADRAARGEVIAGLQEKLAGVEAELEARLALIGQLTGELGESREALADAELAATTRIEADRAPYDEAIARLKEQLAAAERDCATQLAAVERLTADLEEGRGVIARLVEQLAAVERDRAARLALIERLSAELNGGRRALSEAEQAAATRLEAVEADRVARGEVIGRLVEQLAAVERDRAARLALIERLTGELNDSRRALSGAEQAAATRLEAVEADRVARGEVIGCLVEQLAAVERDRAARLALIERLTGELNDSRRALADANQAAAARLEAVEADRVARGEVIGRLVEQLAAVERDRAARLALIERLTGELSDSRRALADANQAAAARLEAVEADRVARGEVIGGFVQQLAALDLDRAARLTLIERLTAHVDELRGELAHAEQVAATRLAAVEADRVARGGVITGLTQRLAEIEKELTAGKSSAERLEEGVRDAERQLADANDLLLQREGDLAAIQQANRDLRRQLSDLEQLANQRSDLITSQAADLDLMAERLGSALGEIASLQRRWSNRIVSFFTGLS